MEVLLIKPYTHISNVLAPLGLAYLATALKRAGISSKVLHCYKDAVDIPRIIDIVNQQGVPCVGVTVCSNDHMWVQRFAKVLEPLTHVKLVLGGPHATGLGKRLMELIPRTDFIVRSEGEISFPQLVHAILNGTLDDATLRAIPNLVWRDASGQCVENPVGFPANLDELQMPDWNQLEPRKFEKYAPHGGFARAAPVAQLITTRGCPYSCRYCAAYVMNGKQIRMRSGESVVEEMRYLMKDHGIREFHIEDDNFTFYKEHVVNVCSAIRKAGIKVPLGIPNGVRVDRLDDEICSEMKSAGFYFFSIGLESGSPQTLKQMKKALNLEKAKLGIQLIKKYGFRVKGFFILGYPHEAKKEMLETIEWSKSLPLDQAYYSIYIPLPGTPEFKSLEEDGLLDIKNCRWEDFYTGKFSDPPYIPDGMTAIELKKLVAYAYRSFYMRPRVLLTMARDVTSLTQVKHLARRSSSLLSGILAKETSPSAKNESTHELVNAK